MGLIYNPNESQELVSNFQANIATCEQIISGLKRGNTHLVNALSSNQLSGAAFTAGQGMFTQLVMPTVAKIDTVIQELKQKLQEYVQCTDIAEGEILDEDKLNQQLQELRRQQYLLTSQIQLYQNQALFNDNPELTTMYHNYANELTNFMNVVQEDIWKVENKLRRLHELDMNIAPLFNGVLDDFHKISTVISVLGSGNFDSGGNFYLESKDGKNKFYIDESFEENILKGGDIAQKLMIVTGYGITGNLAMKEAFASLKKIKNDTWYKSSVKSTKTGLKTWKQVNGDVNRFKKVKGAKKLDEIINGSGKLTSGGIKSFGKSIGVVGGAGAILDGGLTYIERKDKYGQTSAVIDGTAHAGVAVGSIYAGATIGSLIPIPVVGTVAGAVSGYLVGGIANTLWDGFAHGTWNFDNFKLW